MELRLLLSKLTDTNSKFVIVKSLDKEFDSYGDISNYSDDRVNVLEDISIDKKGVIFLHFSDDKEEIKNIIKL